MISSGAWSPRCPVSLDDLRLVTLTYWGFDGRSHTGRLVLNRDAVTPVVDALRRLYRERFPIRRMVPVEAYGASDERSMRADNTSAFNGRFVEGSTVWSQHAYGRAIDVDPLENPEIQDGKVYPATAGRFVDRTLGVPGMIVAGDGVVRAFAAEGWSWGGLVALPQGLPALLGQRHLTAGVAGPRPARRHRHAARRARRTAAPPPRRARRVSAARRRRAP